MKTILGNGFHIFRHNTTCTLILNGYSVMSYHANTKSFYYAPHLRDSKYTTAFKLYCLSGDIKL